MDFWYLSSPPRSRDRLVFSKSLLRRFLRDCLDRDSSLASPWTVKPSIAYKYGVPSDMPETVREGVERLRQGEIDKRKRVWEEKEAQAEREGRFTKKMIKEKEREAKGAEYHLGLILLSGGANTSLSCCQGCRSGCTPA